MGDKSEIAERAASVARGYELDYGCCPQCVLAAVQETVPDSRVTEETIKASHGLSGGGALSGTGLCGSLVGGILALGTRRGRDRDKFEKGKFIGNFKRCNELIGAFAERFGGTTCRELQERFTGRTFDMWDEQEFAEFARLRGERCAETAEFVTRLVVGKL